MSLEEGDGPRSGMPPLDPSSKPGVVPGTTTGRPGRALLHAYVAAVVAAGAAMVLVVARVAGAGIGDVPLLAGFTATLVLSNTFPLLVLRKEETESLQLEDGILVAMMLLLPPFAVLMAFAIGVFIGDSMRRLAPVKVAFNTGQFLLAAGSALLVYRVLVGSGAPLNQQVWPPSPGRSSSSS